MNEIELIKSGIMNNDRFLRLMDFEKISPFTETHAQEIYKALIAINESGLDPSLPTIRKKLIENGIEENEAIDIILKLNSAFTDTNFDHHLDELINQKKKTDAKYFLSALSLDADKLQFEDIEQKTFEFFTQNDYKKKISGTTARKLSETPLDQIFTRNYRKTGIDQIDKILTGIFNEQLICIAARPGQGKTSMALQIACNMADMPVLFFTLEMGVSELWARMLTMQAEVESWRIESNKCRENEIEKVFQAQEFYKHHKIQIFKTSNFPTIMQIIKRESRREKVGLIIIDYLQRISGMSGDNRNLEIQNTTNELKDFSGGNEIPVLLLSQLNRAVENRSDPRPTLADLRESGAIEQDCDVVLFLYEKNNRNFAYVAKNRKGPTA